MTGALAVVPTGQVAGHFGEWMQGRLGPDGPLALVTVPCHALMVTVAATPGGFAVSGAGDGALARRFFKALGELPNLQFHVSADAEPGRGAGVSTAALLAMAAAAGLGPDGLAEAALAAEGAVDPLMLARPGEVLWASREARVVRRFAPLPEFEIVGGFLGAPERTRAEDQDFPDIADLVPMWAHAAERRDRAALAGLSTEAARRTTARRGPRDDPTEALARQIGALGVLRAHTGSARGLIFAPGQVPAGLHQRLARAGITDVLSFRTGGDGA